MRKIMITLALAAALSAGTGMASMAGIQAKAVESQSIDKEGINISTVTQLIGSLPADYNDFTANDLRDFERSKILWDELSRDEMFRILDSHENIFDKYNALYTQEKLSR